MNAMNPFRLRKSINHLAAGALALGLGLFAGAGNGRAQVTYNWTNTVSPGTLTDPGSWSPVGGPGTNLDTFTFLQNGTYTLQLTNNFSNIGSFQFGAANSSGNLNLSLNFGTNV